MSRIFKVIFKWKFCDTFNKCSRQILVCNFFFHEHFSYVSKTISVKKNSNTAYEINILIKSDRMHYKGLYWNTCSSGFLSDRLYQNGSLSRMESKIFIFKGILLSHCIILIQRFNWKMYVILWNYKHFFPADCDLQFIFLQLLEIKKKYFQTFHDLFFFANNWHFWWNK